MIDPCLPSRRPAKRLGVRPALSSRSAARPCQRRRTAVYSYDANGAVTAITYPSGHVVDYTRARWPGERGQDPHHRFRTLRPLPPRRYPSSYSDAYTWDANGNRTRADRTIGASTASDVATIPATSNRLQDVRTASGALAKTFTFRAGGDTAAQTVAPATTFTYDARGRISTVKQGATVAATYLYDFAQHRVASLDAAAAQVHSLFDDEGHLLAEYDALSNNLLREYVWAGDMVLAMATGAAASPAWSYVTTGHLDEPVMVTNPSAAITSSVTRDPWGNTILIAGTNAIALGYPGQWKDLAGGLYHNWNRDYDPTLGRYLEPDPIGLAGGSNVYGYVGGNPVNRVDPMGLTSLLFDTGLGVLYVDPERKGWAPYSLPASSGRPECGCSETAKNRGPIPLGGYELRTIEISGGFFANVKRNYIEWKDFGNWRVPLHPRPGTNTHGRSGFFLHGGSFPGSAGCIDVGGGFWGSPTTNRLRFDLRNDPDGRVPISVIRTVVP